MAINKLTIGAKTANQGVNASGKLTAQEFNELVSKVQEMIDELNRKAYVTQEQYDLLRDNGGLMADVEYNIYEE